MQREALALKEKGKKIGFVPTMGALHEGHISLVKVARQQADVVVMSIYVNPTQFGPSEDFSRYPRPWEQDVKMVEEAGVDILFAPENLYLPDASTFVQEEKYSLGRCGGARPSHFRGVTTIVAKLFNLVQPTVAVFGQKDSQQCDVIEQMIRDLYFPVKIVRAPLIRDARGLALSSRNKYLSPAEYEVALNLSTVLHETIKTQGMTQKELESAARSRLKKVPGMKVDYVTWANGYLCSAVFVGKTRLIDNVPYIIN